MRSSPAAPGSSRVNAIGHREGCTCEATWCVALRHGRKVFRERLATIRAESIASGSLREPVTQKKHSAQSRTTAPVKRGRPGCTCGACNYCIANAKWERIFKEKFEDPSYYTRDRLATASLMSSGMWELP